MILAFIVSPSYADLGRSDLAATERPSDGSFAAQRQRAVCGPRSWASGPLSSLADGVPETIGRLVRLSG